MATYTNGSDVVVKISLYDTSTPPLPLTPVSITIAVKDPTGAAVTAGAPYQVTAGNWASVISAPSVAGQYNVRWTTSGTYGNADKDDQFTVRAIGMPEIIDLTSLKMQIGLQTATSNDTSMDAELEGFIEAATEQIRDIVGPIFPETHVQYFSGGRQSFSVDWRPLQSVTSVTEYLGDNAYAITEQPLGSQVSNFGFTADYATGQLTRRTFGGSAANWASGYKNIQVTYVAGRSSTIPYLVRLAAMELVQHWFGQLKQQRNRTKGSRSGGEESMSMTFAVPWSVAEKLEPFRRPPGVA